MPRTIEMALQPEGWYVATDNENFRVTAESRVTVLKTLVDEIKKDAQLGEQCPLVQFAGDGRPVPSWVIPRLLSKFFVLNA